MQYPIKLKTEKPLFNYIVRFNDSLNYYLFEKIDDALNMARKLGIGCKASLLYEIDFDIQTGEYRGRNTYRVIMGKISYDKHAKVDLHIQFYVSAGEWLNPNQEWLDILNKKKRKIKNEHRH